MDDPAFPPAVTTGAGAVANASWLAVAFALPLVSAKVATTPTFEVAELGTPPAPPSADEEEPVAKTPPPEMTTVPVIAPTVAAVTVMFTVQLAPLARVMPQLSVSLYSPLATIDRLVMFWPVLLVNVAV